MASRTPLNTVLPDTDSNKLHKRLVTWLLLWNNNLPITVRIGLSRPSEACGWN